MGRIVAVINTTVEPPGGQNGGDNWHPQDASLVTGLCTFQMTNEMPRVRHKFAYCCDFIEMKVLLMLSNSAHL